MWGSEKNGNKKTKIHRAARSIAEKAGTAAAPGRAGHPVRGPAAGRAGLCAGRLGLAGAARRAVRPVWLRQFCAGRSGVLPGRAVHPGRRPAAQNFQAGAGAHLCQRHGHRVFRHPAAGPFGLPDSGGLLRKRRERLAGRRRTGRCAGRQPAAALRPPRREPHHAGAGAVRQPVHF